MVPGPASCKLMLVTAAQTALNVPRNERHADQEAVFGMLREIFDAEKGRWESRIADANGVCEKATLEQTEKAGLKDAADAALKAQKEVVRAKLDSQSKADEVVKEFKEEVSAAMALREDAEVSREGITKDQKAGLALQEVFK